MLAVARATAVLCALIELAWAHRSGAPDSFTASEAMFADALAPWFGRRGIHFSWVVMVVVFLTMLTSSAALGLPGAFLPPLAREFGWTTGQVSSALALRFTLFGLIGPFAAVLMERYGMRGIICAPVAPVGPGVAPAPRVTAPGRAGGLWG